LRRAGGAAVLMCAARTSTTMRLRPC